MTLLVSHSLSWQKHAVPPPNNDATTSFLGTCSLQRTDLGILGTSWNDGLTTTGNTRRAVFVLTCTSLS